MDIALGFLSGIGVSIIATIFGSWMQKRSDRNRAIRQTQFEIFMKLLNVHANYFWVVGAEKRKQDVPPQVQRSIYDATWQISDLLRTEDAIPHAEEILTVLMSAEIDSATDRYKRMQALVDTLAKSLSPRYQQIVKSIGEVNLATLPQAPGDVLRRTVPGLMAGHLLGGVNRPPAGDA